MSTKTPWVVVELGEPLDDWTGAHFIIRAKGAPGGVAAIIGGLGMEEERANARLIGAAGAMYEELTTIANFAVGNGDVCEIIARRARAVLRKVHEGME